MHAVQQSGGAILRNIEEFHNAVLKAGSVPLPALEAEIARALP